MVAISNLREQGHFAFTIAERGWSEWGKQSLTLADYLAGVEGMVLSCGIPCAFVAHKGTQYVGSVLLIDNDLSCRPQYSPWIAALWVEPAFRRRGAGERLLEAARGEAGRLGQGTSYLCAVPSKCQYYLARGFRLVERDVEGLNVLAA
jgi:GNAT superfamily N-acetyltransferase